MEKLTKALTTTVVMAVTVVLLALTLAWAKTGTQNRVTLSAEEQRLFELITAYRQQRGLPFAPLSPSLTRVAQIHVRDLEAYPPEGRCNMHSWSAYGDWIPCCYLDDHSQMDCVQLKPGELTSYTGRGYENAHWHSGGATAQSAFNGWKNSPGHHATMVNLGMWADRDWKAIGVGIYGKYAVAWFGHEDDPAGVIVLGEAGSATREATRPSPTRPSRPIEQQRQEPQRFERPKSGNLRLTHTATQQRGREYWDVRVQVVGSADDLDRIQWVDYTLHPTFNPSQRSVDHRASNYALSLSCWGQFTIKAVVVYRNGETVSLERYLSFDEQ